MAKAAVLAQAGPIELPRPSDRAGLITDAFAEIGRVNGTMMPRSHNPQERVAYEYWVASLLARLSEARRERAKKAAVAAAILPDHVASPMPIGTAETVYAGDVVTISVKVVEQSPRLDVAGFLAEAEKLGIPPAKLRRMVKKHTTQFSGAHVFTASLVSG